MSAQCCARRDHDFSFFWQGYTGTEVWEITAVSYTKVHTVNTRYKVATILTQNLHAV